MKLTPLEKRAARKERRRRFAETELPAWQSTASGDATPAVAGGALLLRGQKTLFCVGQ